MALVQYVKNAGRTRHSAKKAGITIEDPASTRKDNLIVEQEQPDIM